MKDNDDNPNLQQQRNHFKIHTFGHFQAFLNSKSTKSYSDKDEKVNISLVMSPRDIAMELNLKEFYNTFLNQRQDERNYDKSSCFKNSNMTNQQHGFLKSNEVEDESVTESCNDTSYYYLVFSSNDEKHQDASKMLAVYKIIHHCVNDKMSYKCINKEQFCYLTIEEKNQKITIQHLMSHHTHKNCTKSSNIYILQSHHAFSCDSRSSKCQYELFLVTPFECNLFFRSLHSISALTSTNDRIISMETDDTKDLSSYKSLHKTREKKSGIIIKVRKVDAFHNSYVIIDSSSKVTVHDQKPSYKKLNQPILDTKRRIKSENGNQKDCSDATKNDNYIIEPTNSDGGKIEFGDELSNFGSFYFISPEDKTIVSDFMFLLMAQVKRGTLNSKDRDNARRKNSVFTERYLGLRCRHCGGIERGNYFPTTCKNLQACPSMIFKHLMSCDKCPPKMKQLLKTTKSKHKAQVLEKENGAQIRFYNTLWERIHDSNFDGGNDDSRDKVISILKDIYSSFFNITKATVSQVLNTSKEDTNSAVSTQMIQETKKVDLQSSSQVVASTKQSSAMRTKIQYKDHMITATVKDLPNSSKIASTKSSPRIKLQSKDPTVTIPVTTASNTTGGKCIDRIRRIPYSENPPSIPEISIDPRTGHIKSMFESQSLNVTLDMLDAVAGEIRNSASYSFTPGKRKLKDLSLNVVETQWDMDSFNNIKEMVESDEDYREMINILAHMDTSEDIESMGTIQSNLILQ